MALLEVGYLTLCFFASNSVALLNPADELIALPSTIRQLFSVNLPHFSLALPRSCF